MTPTPETTPTRKRMRLPMTALLGVVLLECVLGCHRKPPTPQAMQSDIKTSHADGGRVSRQQ